MLIIYANPSRKGHCGEILKQLISRLERDRIDYEVLDLYVEKFDPVLRDKIDPMVKSIQNKILDNDRFVFIYPNWWASVPAILKGFFDKVLAAGFAFKYVNSRPKSLLKNKKAMILNTTGGPFIYQFLIGRPSVRIVKNYVLKFCGFDVDYSMLCSALKMDKKRQNQILQMIDKTLKFLN